MKRLEKRTIERWEFAVAVLMSFLLIAFHIIFFLHAGALWRDEISSLSLATRPTFAEFWKNLRFDPFPAAYFLLLRLWHVIGLGETDLALRGLGLLIGISLIGAFWVCCYLIDKSPPLWPLALFSFNPLVLEGGDSLRPYGFGLIWIVLAFACFWRMATGKFGKGAVALVTIFAVLSVQSLFTNAFMILGFGVGAVVLLLAQRSWSKSAVVIVIGLIAAFTLLPYVPAIQAIGDWSNIISNKNDLGSLALVARDAIADAGSAACWIWLALIVGTLVGLTISPWTKLAAHLQLDRNRALFGGMTLVVSAAAIIIFLIVACYPVFPRHFLPAMATAALCLHLFWHALPDRAVVRFTSLLLGLFVVAVSLPAVYPRTKMRMTNCDKIASLLEEKAGANDLIIVTACFYGVSFQRYYRGGTNWIALPPVADFSLHRLDLVKEAMASPDPVPELVARAETVLRNGHKLFLVGKLGPPLSKQPEPLPPAPQSEFGWEMGSYEKHWKAELTYWIEHHGVHGNELSIHESAMVNPFEQLGLFEVSGWRED